MALSGLRGKAASFLLGLLRPATQARYHRALEAFEAWADLGKVVFGELNEEKQDFLLGDYLLELRDAGAPLYFANDVIAAV